MDNNYGREFKPDTDIKKLQHFCVEMRNKVSQGGYFHLGDLLFRINLSSNKIDVARDIRIWEDSERINGFVFYIPTLKNPEFLLRPELYGSSISKEMVDWTIERAKQGKADKIEVSCIDTDKKKEEFLIENSFTKFDDPYVFMEKSLDSVPSYSLPEGYSFISNNDRPDLPGVTGNVENTRKEYQRMCSPDEYIDDLGLRVCYNQIEIAAGCICWFDRIDNSGLFEPVGTNEKHRKKGLAFLVMTKTMENLKKYGADKVYVRTTNANKPAIRLYESLGFNITDIDNGWELKIV
ncbi:MAG: GNAT family N-acetyltransferase [bacterium]|nr:GNAT family N-acetyltransferase [bacterium]